MPELPEVETIRQFLDNKVNNLRITKVKRSKFALRFPFPKSFSKQIINSQIKKITRRGKYLLFYLNNDKVIIMHLGMTGRLTLLSNKNYINSFKKNIHDHIIFYFHNSSILVFNDTRRFGHVTIETAELLYQNKFLKFLGPEPLTSEFNYLKIIEPLKKCRQEIKQFLLNQKFIAGLGNIYVSEILFKSKISPFILANQIDKKKAKNLVKSIKYILVQAIKAGGSTLRDYRKIDGSLGYFQFKWKVYSRNSQKCTRKSCRGVIKKVIQNKRATYYCSVCQK